jgi:hypothetical protein
VSKSSQEQVEIFIHRWSYASEGSDEEVVRPRSVWRVAYGYWMRFARALGRANALLLLTIVYIVLIGPAAIVLKIFGKDLLDRKAGNGSTLWFEKAQEPLSIERSRQPF